MPPAIKNIIESVDRDEVQRVIAELRQQLEACEELLAAVQRFELNANGELVVNGGERLSVTRKRELVLAIMRGQHGRWTTRQVREALAAQGIDPRVGTPIKNILWNLAKEGHVHAVGGGVYELSVLAEGAEHDHREALAA
jgi:hypothetical protein